MLYLQRYLGQLADPSWILPLRWKHRKFPRTVERANQSNAMTYQLLANAARLSIDSSPSSGEDRRITPHRASFLRKEAPQVALFEL